MGVWGYMKWPTNTHFILRLIIARMFIRWTIESTKMTSWLVLTPIVTKHYVEK
jgi:hypothetical protein